MRSQQDDLLLLMCHRIRCLQSYDPVPVFLQAQGTGRRLSAHCALPPLLLSTPALHPPCLQLSSLQSCVRARPFKMVWSISVEMAENLLLTTLVGNFFVLSLLNLRPHGERLKPLPLQLWVQIFITLASSAFTKGVSFVGISNPVPFVICCTAYSVYGVWNLLRRGPEDDFHEVMMFNVVVAAMGKFSEYLA